MKFLRSLLALITSVLVAIAAAGHFGGLHPALDSLAQFRIHVDIVCMAAGLMLFLVGMRRSGGLALALAAISMATTMLPVYTGVSRAHANVRLPYHFVQMNLMYDAVDTKSALRVIAESNADVISLQETTDRWLGELATIKSAYPYQKKCAAIGRVGGVAIISRRPFIDHPANSCGEATGLMVQAIDLNGRILLAGSVHLHWPWPYAQSNQVSAMTGLLQKTGGWGLPIIIGGDMNAAIWSETLTRISSASHTSIVPYAGGSWMPKGVVSGFAALLGLPIDNLLTSKVLTGPVNKLEPTGSDHLPLMLDFQMPAQAQTDTPDTARV